jgi:hypothetical protein
MIQKLYRICLAVGTLSILVNNNALALDCSEKISSRAELSRGSYADLGKIISRLKVKDPGALENGVGKIELIRRFSSGEASARGGNIAAEIPLTNISRGLTISYGKQKIKDFAIDPVFVDMNLSTVVRVRQSICSGGSSCVISAGGGLDRFLAELIECNGGKKAAFEFDDAFLVLDMELIKNLAIGEGVIIQKRHGKLQPKALVISQ